MAGGSGLAMFRSEVTTSWNSFFPEPINGWTVAETHVLSKKIVPNGRRDNYEHSAHLSDLLTRLTPVAKDIAHRCRTSSISRNAIQRHEAELAKCEESIAIASKPRTPAFVVASLREEITTCLTGLERTFQRGLFSDSEGDKFESRVKKISNRLKALPEAPDSSDALKDFPPGQRQIIKEVIETIYLTESAWASPIGSWGELLRGSAREDKSEEATRLCRISSGRCKQYYRFESLSFYRGDLRFSASLLSRLLLAFVPFAR